jgi:maltooligosyltrehalose trehalohydrolase
MSRISVWAPMALSVEMESGGCRTALIRGDGGWWEIETDMVAHGVDYDFVIDGGEPLPDPRSPWQPQGVHGHSRWVDHTLFTWNDSGWQQLPLASAIIYEIHIGTFISEGTFDAVIDRLDYLLGLGVTHLELMPVAEFHGTCGWGYDGVDIYAPHHAYGGPDGLKRLVNACHSRGIAVILDVVYNHLGPSGNYLDRFGPYFTKRYETPWGKAVNLDGPYSEEVRRFFIDNALMWLRDYHMDGLRIDAVHAIVDTSAIHFLEQLADEVRKLEAQQDRRMLIIAESDLNDPRLVRPQASGGYGLDAQWNEDFHHALHAVLTGEHGGYYGDFGRLADLAKAITRGFVYDGCYSAYRRRRHGRNAEGLSGHKFIGSLQNHDQVGNRAQGERTSHLLSLGKLKIGAAILLTSPFVPMLFQGEEWGASSPFLYFVDCDNSQLADAVRRGRREEFAGFGWKPDEIPDPNSPETVARSILVWDEMSTGSHAELLEWHRKLIELRHRLPSLTDGRMWEMNVSYDEEAGWISIHRGEVLVVCNMSGQLLRVPFPDNALREFLLVSENRITIDGEGVLMPGQSVALLATHSG